MIGAEPSAPQFSHLNKGIDHHSLLDGNVFFMLLTVPHLLLLLDLLPLLVVIQQKLVLLEELDRIIPLLTKRILDFSVGFLVFQKQTFRNQTSVKHFSDLFLIKVLANKHYLDPLVTVGLLPVSLNELGKGFHLAFVRDPLALRHFHVPGLFDGVKDTSARLLDEELIARVVGQPEEPLGSGDFFPKRPIFLLSDEGVEFFRIERSPLPVDEAGDVIFNSFRDVFEVVFLSNPTLRYFSLFEVETPLEDFVEVYLGETGFEDVRPRVDSLQISLHGLLLLIRDQIYLIYYHHICNLELIQHEFRYCRSLLQIHFFGILLPTHSAAGRTPCLFLFFDYDLVRNEVLLEVFSINNSHHSIDLGVFLNARSVCEGLSHGERS